jgi:hypothetical protein
MPPVDGRLAGRLEALRTPARDRDATVRDRGTVEPDLPGDESPEASLPEADIAIVPGLAAVDRVAVRDRDVVRGLAVVDRRAGAAPAGFADCIVLAAVVNALAALVIAFVAVFMARIADDIVRAEAVAFVAADDILVAADVTLVAAVDTPLAAVAGVVLGRPDTLRRVDGVVRVVPALLAVPRLPEVVVRRVVVERDAVGREAVDRDAVLRVVVRDAVVRGLAAVPPADGIADDALEPDMDDDRLAVPRDALRLAGLLRAELAEPRRVAARVVD